MSDGLFVKPGSGKHVHFEQDSRESMVDIYVSTESLRVYDIPWVEEPSPNSPGPLQAQSRMTFISETSPKRSSFRWHCVFLGVVCLLLLIGNIYLGVEKYQNDKGQLEKNNSDCRNLTLEQLAKKLCDKIEALCNNPCGNNKKECRGLC